MFPVVEKGFLSLKEIENGFKKCNSIKYAAYRTAAKLRVLQKAFYLDKIQLKIISSVFERHHLQQTENSVQLDQKEVESVVSDIYFAVKKGNDIPLDVDYSSQLLFTLLSNMYDKKMTSTVQVFSIKVGLTLLCQAKPREKYHYLFEQLADHNNCLSRKKLEILLKKMISLTEYLGEGLSFGSDLIPGTVESCFQCNVGNLGLSEDVFLSWLMQDPQLLVWLSTLYRMQISELVSHDAKCGNCKIYPLVGLRYRCLRCLSYDMCQSCFFAGKLNKKHKLNHPVQEYCCPMTSQQSTKAFLLTLRNRLYKKDCKLQYLPALKVDSQRIEPVNQSTRLLDEMEVSSRTVVNGSRVSLHRFPYKELQNIILQLEKESEKIIPQIDDFCSGVEEYEGDECKARLKNCLMRHKAEVRAQIQRLKLLRNYLSANGKFSAKAFLASTPVVDEILSAKRKSSVDSSVNLSPITVRGFDGREEASSEKNMMWDNYDLGSYGLNPSWEEVESCNRERNTFGVTDVARDLERGKEEKEGKDESEFQLSTWLGGKTLRELDSSLRKGTSWLYEENGTSAEEDKIREENEETLERLQYDLKKILNKLQELSIVTARGDEGLRCQFLKGHCALPPRASKQMAGPLLSTMLEGVFWGKDSSTQAVPAVLKAAPDTNSGDTDLTDVDTLLVDLINGIEKLMS